MKEMKPYSVKERGAGIQHRCMGWGGALPLAAVNKPYWAG